LFLVLPSIPMPVWTLVNVIQVIFIKLNLPYFLSKSILECGSINTEGSSMKVLKHHRVLILFIVWMVACVLVLTSVRIAKAAEPAAIHSHQSFSFFPPS